MGCFGKWREGLTKTSGLVEVRYPSQLAWGSVTPLQVGALFAGTPGVNELTDLTPQELQTRLGYRKEREGLRRPKGGKGGNSLFSTFGKGSPKSTHQKKDDLFSHGYSASELECKLNDSLSGPLHRWQAKPLGLEDNRRV